MKNYLKDKKVLVGLVVVAALGYYLYDRNKKAKIKSDAQIMASTPDGGTSVSLGSEIKLEKELEAPTAAGDVFSIKKK
jgi:hypothetical protein